MKRGKTKRQPPARPAFDPASIPPGFVAGRLASELQAMLADLGRYRRLVAALGQLSKRPEYSALTRDLVEEMQPLPAPVRKGRARSAP